MWIDDDPLLWETVCDHAYWKKRPMNLVDVCAFAWYLGKRAQRAARR